MINANELRLGNWVKDDNITFQVSFCTMQFLENDIKTIQPIPLIEEWLLKFGFVLSKDLGDMKYYQLPNKKYGFGILLDHEDWCFYYYDMNGIKAFAHDEYSFYYVHQLQNIYFALTNTELQCKS